jgi:signal transduction histidine kinase
MNQELKFTVDSALLRELGEKLVETVHLAVSELVKNAYDADATEVQFIFETLDGGESRIRIVDNGVGMNFSAVENYWMRIATANKVDRFRSPVYGRYVTGAKGIGRFSCRRLGTRLTLITRAAQDGYAVGRLPAVESTKVVFPWTEFEAGADVTTIICKGEREVLQNESTGTELIIEGVSEEEWTTRGLQWLKRQLAVLAANRGAKREGYEEDPGFNVKIIAPDFEEGVRDLRGELINAGWGTLKAFVNSKHQAVCELDAFGIGKRTITSNVTFPNLRDIKLHFGIMVENRTQMRDTGVLSQGTLSEILPHWGGIQVRHLGFRVYPYGDDDWLKIDHDRGLRKAAPKNQLLALAESLRGVDASNALLNMLSSRSYIGNVEIGPDSVGFEMKANREGFLKSSSVDELKEFVRFAIDWTTILRDYHIRQETRERALIAQQEFESFTNQQVETVRLVDSALEYIDKELISVARNLEPAERRKVEQTVGKATEAIRKFNQSTQMELAHLRLIASTSTLLLIFSHEVKSLLGLLEQSKNALVIIADQILEEHKSQVLSITSDFSLLKSRLEELLQMTTLISEDKTKATPGQVALKSKLVRVGKVFELVTNRYEISVDYSQVANNIVVKKILEAELYSILLNVLSNSIKSVIARGQDKAIRITASMVNGATVISVLDNGIGLSEDRFEEVFTPFVADPEGRLYSKLEQSINPEDSMIVGSGSGLGLGIVKEIVSAHGGSVRFKIPPEGWSSEIEITMP